MLRTTFLSFLFNALSTHSGSVGELMPTAYELRRVTVPFLRGVSQAASQLITSQSLGTPLGHMTWSLSLSLCPHWDLLLFSFWYLHVFSILIALECTTRV